MQDKKPLIVTGLVLLLILVLVGAVIFYLVSFPRSRQAPEATGDLFPRSSFSPVVSPSPGSVTLASPSPVVSSAPVTGSTGAVYTNPSNPNQKIYAGSGFQLTYPQNWGILTCSNSQSFEFDPYNSRDQISIVCNRAVKPVTVQVTRGGCAGGQSVTLGNVQVRESIDNAFNTSAGTGTQYKWCTQTSPTLIFTERVGRGSSAYGRDDFSAQVKQVISSLSFPAGS